VEVTNEERQDIDRQKRELRKQGIKDQHIYFEYESGTKDERVQLNRLLQAVKDGDTIAATEVSRLTRSTKQLCELIELAKERRLKLVIGTFVVDCTQQLDPMTDGMLKMMGVFAEMERNMISQRVKSGMQNAVAKGAKLGRPKVSVDRLPHSFLKHYPKYKADQITLTELASLCKRSRTTVYYYISVFEGKPQKPRVELDLPPR
jgi:DNA invertase Pin-like site-specific DNA recombinase